MGNSSTNSVSALIAIAIVLGSLWYLKNKHWWYFPNKQGIKAHLSVCSDKEIELRFKEAINIQVVKSLFITITIGFFSLFGVMFLNNYLEPTMELQNMVNRVELMKETENYKKAMDTEKDKAITSFVTKDNSLNDAGIAELTIAFSVPTLFFIYVGFVKRSRIEAIYELIHERKIEERYSVLKMNENDI